MIGRGDPDMPQPPVMDRRFPPEPPEDVVRPSPPMQRRGMGGRGQGRGIMNRDGQGFSPGGMVRPGQRGPEPKPEND